MVNSTSSLDTDVICTVYNTIPIPNAEYAADWLFTETDRIIMTILLPIVIIVGVLGNLAFLFMIYRLKRMHTLTNAYLANIAVADIILVTFAPIVYVMSYFVSPMSHNMPLKGPAGCYAAFFISYTGYYASLFNVTLVSLERWLAICRPLQHRRMKGKSRTIKFVAAAWVLAALITVLNVPKHGKSITYCVDWPDSEEYLEMPRYFHTCGAMNKHFENHPEIIELLIFIVAFIVNGMCFIMIIHTLSGRSVGVGSDSNDDQNTKIRNQVARLLIINGIVFFICHVPAQLTGLNNITYRHFDIDLLTDSQDISITIFGRTFECINSAVNVFIYAFSSRFYRDGFREIFRCSCGDQQQKTRNTIKTGGISSATVSGRV